MENVVSEKFCCAGTTLLVVHKSITGKLWRILSLRNFVAQEWAPVDPPTYWVYCGKLDGEELHASLLNVEFA